MPRTSRTVTVEHAGANGDNYDSCRSMDITDGYGLRVETGRSDPDERGRVVCIISRSTGAIHFRMTVEQARELSGVLAIAASDVQNNDGPFCTECHEDAPFIVTTEGDTTQTYACANHLLSVVDVETAEGPKGSVRVRRVKGGLSTLFG